jgi:hypothetical protein
MAGVYYYVVGIEIILYSLPVLRSTAVEVGRSADGSLLPSSDGGKGRFEGELMGFIRG